MQGSFETQFLVDGSVVDAESDETIPTENPATGERMADVPVATRAEVDRAVAAARGALDDGWRMAGPDRREAVLRAMADVIRENRDALLNLEVANNGSPIWSMEDDVDAAIDRLEYYAQLAHEVSGDSRETSGNTINYAVREPVGVVGAVLPFNHPFLFAVARIAPALAVGNAIVLKPSEYTPLSALAFGARLADDDRIPDGVVNIVAGGPTVGDAITSHDDVDMITFIGSVGAGRAIMGNAAEKLAPVLLELGGKNPSIVFPDADLDDAVQGCTTGMNFRTQGQSCGSGSRVLVHEDVRDDVVAGMVEAFEDITVGDPSDPEVDTGAVVSEPQFEQIIEYVEIGKEDGATLRTGGGAVEGLAGYFVEPTIFDDVSPTSRIAQEEIFGPVVSVIEWRDYDELIEIVNGVDQGLSASIWTENVRTAMETAKRVEAGYVWVNQHGPHYKGAPFGGVKDSGLGRTGCLEELYAHTVTKNVNVDLDRTAWDW